MTDLPLDDHRLKNELDVCRTTNASAYRLCFWKTLINDECTVVEVHHARKVVLAAMFDVSVASEGGVGEQLYDSGPTFSQYFHSFLDFIGITSLSPPDNEYSPLLSVPSLLWTGDD